MGEMWEIYFCLQLGHYLNNGQTIQAGGNHFLVENINFNVHSIIFGEKMLPFDLHFKAVECEFVDNHFSQAVSDKLRKVSSEWSAEEDT